MKLDRKKIVGIVSLIVFILFSAAVIIFIGRPLVRFAGEPERFREWVADKGVWGPLSYIGMVVLQVFVALIPGEPLEIAGGYAFGTVGGTALCLCGETLGSILVFALVRRFGMKLVECFFSREKLDKLKFLRSSPKRDGFLFLLFLLPGTPKDLLCYFTGLTDVSWGAWLIICSVCRIPSVITSTVGGSAINDGNIWLAVIAFAVALAVGGLGLIIYNRIVKAHAQNEPENVDKDVKK